MSNNNYLFTKEEIEEFFRDRKEHLSEHFIYNARYTLNYLCFHWKQKGVEIVTPAKIARTLKTKYDVKTGEFLDKSLKRTSLKNLLNRVVMFYIWKLGDTHSFVTNLRKYTKDIKVPQLTTKHVPEETIKYMLDKLPTNYAFLIWLGVHTSARRSALCNMNIDDINICKFQDLERFLDPDTYDELLDKWVDEEAAVIHRWDKYGGEHAKKEIEIPLFPDDMPKLLDFLSERYILKEELQNSFKDENGEFLFWNEKYKRMNPESSSKYISNFCKKHGIKFTIHDTRHYAIQKWYRMGMRKPTIKKFTGHRSNIIDMYLDVDKITAFSELARINLDTIKRRDKDVKKEEETG